MSTDMINSIKVALQLKGEYAINIEEQHTLYHRLRDERILNASIILFVERRSAVYIICRDDKIELVRTAYIASNADIQAHHKEVLDAAAEILAGIGAEVIDKRIAYREMP